MNATLRHCLVGASAVFVILVPLQAIGGTQTASLSVTATVASNCSISTTPVAFGSYDPIVTNASSPLNSTGTVTVTCTTGSAPSITLGQGSNPAGGSTGAIPIRRMISGGNYLTYYLYSNSGYSTVWSTTAPTLAAGNGAAQQYTVYGQIPSGQNVPSGSYSDTVVATVTF